MAVVLRVKSDSASIFIRENNKWTHYAFSNNMVTFLGGLGDSLGPMTDFDGERFIFAGMKEDKIKATFYNDNTNKYDSKPAIEVYKGTRFGKKVPNVWSVMAKLLEIGFPSDDVPKSGVIWEWTHKDLIAYAEKLKKAMNNGGIGVQKIEDVMTH